MKLRFNFRIIFAALLISVLTIAPVSSTKVTPCNPVGIRNYDDFYKEKILSKLKTLNPETLETYISTDKLLTTNPKARIFAIESAFKIWGRLVEHNTDYYNYLISDYMTLKEKEKVYITYHKIYDLKYPINTQDSGKTKHHTIKRELSTLLCMHRRADSNNNWFKPFVKQKAHEFLRRYSNLTDEQRKLPNHIIKVYTRIERNKEALQHELNKIKIRANKILQNIATFIKERDEPGLSNYLSEVMINEHFIKFYPAALIKKYGKYKELKIKIIKIGKHESGYYVVRYSWQTKPKIEKSFRYAGPPSAEFRMINGVLILESL